MKRSTWLWAFLTVAACGAPPEDGAAEGAASTGGLPLAAAPAREAAPSKAAPAAASGGESEKEIIVCSGRTDRWSTVEVHAGNWGSWATCPEYCPAGSFAYGINLKSEVDQRGGDDTSVNAVSLHCYDRTTGAFTGYVESSMGPWGGWLGTTLCNNTNTPIVSGNLRLEAPQGGGTDDTSANGIMVSCAGNLAELAVPATTSWGTFRGKKSCPSGTAVCGISTRLEAGQGSGDDTALNGVRFECCQLCPAGQEGCSDGICRTKGTCPVPPPPR